MSVGIKHWSTLDKIVSPVNSSLEQGIVNIPNALALRFALRPELTYDLPLTSRLILTPSIGYDAPLTSVDIDQNWKASSAYGAIALRYAIGSF